MSRWLHSRAAHLGYRLEGAALDRRTPPQTIGFVRRPRVWRIGVALTEWSCGYRRRLLG